MDLRELLWNAFNKVYDYTYLNDFARYVCLSALSRGSSEWPLSLVDFRTVLELEIKQCFSEEINDLRDADNYSLCRIIEELDRKGIIDDYRMSFDSIRIAGNIAAHKLYASDDYKLRNINDFIAILEFFNNYCKNHPDKINNPSEYPLRQLDIKEFCERLDEEKSNLNL